MKAGITGLDTERNRIGEEYEQLLLQPYAKSACPRDTVTKVRLKESDHVPLWAQQFFRSSGQIVPGPAFLAWGNAISKNTITKYGTYQLYDLSKPWTSGIGTAAPQNTFWGYSQRSRKLLFLEFNPSGRGAGGVEVAATLSDLGINNLGGTGKGTVESIGFFTTGFLTWESIGSPYL